MTRLPARARPAAPCGAPRLLALVALVSTGCRAPFADPDPGVAQALAEQRAADIADLRYSLHLEVPESRDEPVTGSVAIRFQLRRGGAPLVLDFRAPEGSVQGLTLDGDSVPFTTPADHIVIPGRHLRAGAREVIIAFRSAEDALNRQADFLYALFVPDRASTAFPAFEQPDLKARLTLSLGVPAGWAAVANGAEASRDSGAAGRVTVRFAETEPISTYLFAFAAGRLASEQAVRDGRTLVMYHRETDTSRVARNREAIFDLHAGALRWLEEYTGIPYPFGKFAFFAIPAFQFGGMEHPGAVWYRAESLFLDESASRNQELGRASLIAHETAHMWFGDLVTMRWFDDVWMKEVFANFMAAKIAGPAFPDLNLELRFFQAHHPAAYAVDRTAGANPIRQPLENLRQAGSLYGAIIYQKAPVVMRQLEQLVGEGTLRDGLRQYLAEHRFGNATWPDLVGILDARSDEDLSAWSRAWVREPGRPVITAEWADSGIRVRQADPVAGRNLVWSQPVVLAAGWGDSVTTHRVRLRSTEGFAAVSAGAPPRFILAGADGIGYGRFVLDSASREGLLSGVHQIGDPVHRAVAWQALWEELLDGALPPVSLLDATMRGIAEEPEELILLQLLGQLRGTWWRYLPDSARQAVAGRVEQALWRRLGRASTPGQKGALFGTIQSVTLTAPGVARLERIWRRLEAPRGLPLAEQQFTALAEALALRGVPNAEAILDEQEGRITNPDRLARLRFIRPALSADPARRDSLFRSFADVANRRRESWVLDAMGVIHHPLRARASLGQIRPALDLVEEIQQTGDIFFPLRWMNAVLDGHRSPEAADLVRTFLQERPDLPPRLRGKVLQAADELFRAARLGEGRAGPGG